MKQEVLIIYSDPYLAYSPSTINLFECLNKDFSVRILTVEPDGNFSKQKIGFDNVEYLSVADSSLILLWYRLRNMLSRYISRSKRYNLHTAKANAFITRIKRHQGPIISVDFFSLWCVQVAGKQAHFLSLEIYEKDEYRNRCDFTRIKSVIIQSRERYNYLFPSLDLKKFIIQNAPKYQEVRVNPKLRNPSELVFCGSAMAGFGIFSCVEFIQDYSEYSLTVKGAIPLIVRNVLEKDFASLIATGRLVLDDKYIPSELLTEYLNRFRIGFVFYDYFRFDYINKFNYQTAPSGKLFQYYNAGLPVVASDLLGLSSVKEYYAGVCINTLSSKSIKSAIDLIESDYDNFVKGAKEASAVYDVTGPLNEFRDYFNSTEFQDQH